MTLRFVDQQDSLWFDSKHGGRNDSSVSFSIRHLRNAEACAVISVLRKNFLIVGVLERNCQCAKLKQFIELVEGRRRF